MLNKISGGQIIFSLEEVVWLIINMHDLIIKNIIYGYQILNIEVMGRPIGGF